MKILLKVLPIVIFTLFGANMAMAQFTILPQAANPTQCETLLTKNNESTIDGMLKGNFMREEVLGCAIITGRVSFSMIPYYITYIANFMLSLGGIIAVLFIVIGGYYYIYGGVMDQKEKGKKTVIHALTGLVLGILSWVIVQVIITAITS